MMQIKHMVAIASLTLSLPLTALANDKSDEVIKALNLQGAKAEQVEDIMENYHDQRKEVKERARDSIKALKEQKKQQLEVVLTDAEMDQLEAWHDAKKKRYEKDDMYKNCKKWKDKYED